MPINSLIAFTESEARRSGRQQVRLYTHVLMVENIALYNRLGFRETGRVSEITLSGRAVQIKHHGTVVLRVLFKASQANYTEFRRGAWKTTLLQLTATHS